NLYVGTDKKIDSNKVLDISLNNLDQLEITLNTQYIKYKVEANPNIVYRGNKLVVSNLGFYQNIIISERLLANLQNWIQDFINEENNKFTRDEFVDQLNTSLFKSKIAAYLQISVNDIKTINYTGQYLEITPVELKKFSSDNSNSTFIVNDEIHVNNLRFYSETNLVNLSRLYTALNLYITDEQRKYTVNELKDVLANSPAEIKTLISNNLNTASSGMIDENDIRELSVNENNELIITLNGDYIKYSGKDDANVVVRNTTITVKNLEFYTSISLSETNLELIHTHIQNYITDNNIADNAESITDIEIFNLIKDIRTEDNKKLGDFINTPVRASRVVEITLKPFVKLTERQTNNVEAQSDKIIVKNLILSTTAGYFEWEGTKIVGLTDLGLRQTSIVVPSECTEIKNDVFFANKKIEHVDLSNTSITELKEDIFSGSFSGASNLKTIRFPKTLKKIAGYTFAGCTSLTNVEFPEGLSYIGPFAFADCHSLKTIKIPNLITDLPQDMFFRCTSLTTVQLPENLKTIDMEVFEECVNLESINIPDSITKIVFSAFKGCHNPNLKLYCASEETRQRVSNMTLTSIKKEQIVVKTN
nr:leucine-rich repeat domain-containing protein [Ureaplasma sp.]